MTDEPLDTQLAEAPLEAKPAAPQFDIDKAFRLDEKRVIDGAPIELASGVFIYVARLNNPKYAERLLRFYRKNRFAIERNLIDNNEADEQLCELLAETIFVGMVGFYHGGQPLEDTVANRAWALRTYPALRETVVEQAQNIANFRAAELEDEGKD